MSPSISSTFPRTSSRFSRRLVAKVSRTRTSCRSASRRSTVCEQSCSPFWEAGALAAVWKRYRALIAGAAALASCLAVLAARDAEDRAGERRGGLPPGFLGMVAEDAFGRPGVCRLLGEAPAVDHRARLGYERPADRLPRRRERAGRTDRGNALGARPPPERAAAAGWSISPGGTRVLPGRP